MSLPSLRSSAAVNSKYAIRGSASAVASVSVTRKIFRRIMSSISSWDRCGLVVAIVREKGGIFRGRIFSGNKRKIGVKVRVPEVIGK